MTLYRLSTSFKENGLCFRRDLFLLFPTQIFIHLTDSLHVLFTSVSEM